MYKCLFWSVASGCGRGDPCFNAFVLNVQGGQGQKHWFENETSHVKPYVWAEGYGGVERTGANTEEWGTGVSTLKKHMGWGRVFEVGGLIRMPCKLGCNLGVTMDTTTNGWNTHWSHIDNNTHSSLQWLVLIN